MPRKNYQPTSSEPLSGAIVPASQLLPVPVPANQNNSVPGGDLPGGGLPLSHYSWLLRTHFTKMLVFVVLVMLATALITIRLTPIYESTATLYVDRAAERDAVGKESTVTAADSTDSDAYLASQIKLLQSDSVVRPLAEQYNLLEREGQIKPGKDSQDKILNVKSAPIVLKGLRISRPPNTYILQISYRSTDPAVATSVANGIADSYIKHIYDIRFRSSKTLSTFLARQLDELRAKMESSSARLASLERELNVINPEEKTNILSARLLELNTQYSKVQADRARAQSAWNSLRAGSLEAALGSSQSEELKSIMKRLNEERQRFADIKARYGSNHPEYARLEATVKELEGQVASSTQLLAKQSAAEYMRAQNEESLLQKDVTDTKAEYDRLNLRSFEYQRAKQEAEADRALYEELVKKIREGQINSGFQNDMIRIADPARPASKPVFPSIPLNMALALFLSSALAVIAVVVSDRIDTTIRNPDQITQGLNARVIGVLPILKKTPVLPGIPGSGLSRLPAGTDLAVPGTQASGFEEAIRTIRNSMLLTDFDRRLRSVLMTSATPAEGKSTVVAHLAIAHAEQHHKTLLIDGDMRRPSLHKLFHLHNTDGLSTVVERKVAWRDLLIQPNPDLELYILPAGPPTRRSADLIGQILPHLLEDAAEDFDLVLLDAPPILGFPEPLQMAAAADGVIVVTRAGQTDRTAVAAVLDTLNQLRANVVGLVLNQVKRDNASSYRYYAGNYGNYYSKPAEDRG